VGDSEIVQMDADAAEIKKNTQNFKKSFEIIQKR
jgi:hypothetical protein